MTTARRSTSSTRIGGRPTAGSTSRAWPPVSRREAQNYLMFNLNGHPYFGIDEKIELWKWYQGQIEIPEIGDIRIMRTTISGDLGWIASEGVFPLRPIGEAGTGSGRGRLTRSMSPRSAFARPRSTSVTTARGTPSGGCGTSTAPPSRRRTSHVRPSTRHRPNAALAALPGASRFAWWGSRRRAS